MNILLYLSTLMIWGSTWVAITFQLGKVPLEVSVFYRFGLASLLIFIWCFFRKGRFNYSLRTHVLFFFQGLFLFSLNYILCYLAGQYITSGLNAIAFSMVLVFNIIYSALFYRTRITGSVILGAFLGISGMTAIFLPSILDFDFTNKSLIGITYSLCAAMLASLGNMISAKNQKENIPVTESNAYAMGYGALFILGIILVKGIPFSFDASFSYVVSLLHLTIFGSVIAFGCYLTLLGRIGATKAGYTQMLIPVIALTISTFYENLIWVPHMFLGVAIILLGNFIILTPILDQCVNLIKKVSIYISKENSLSLTKRSLIKGA